MASLAEILEGELGEAFEVKNADSLHRYSMLLADSIVTRTDHVTAIESVKSDVAVVAESMREGFRRMDERFEAVDRRFEETDRRIEDLIAQMNRRFEAVDKRFEDLLGQMNGRFEAVDRRFEDLTGQMNSRFKMMFTFMTIGFTLLTVLISLFGVVA